MQTIKVTSLKGDFSDSSWNTAIVKQVNNVQFSAKGMMRDFTESDFNISINHTSALNLDLGFTGIIIYQGSVGMWTGDGSAVSSQHSLILAYPPSDKTNVGIFRP